MQFEGLKGQSKSSTLHKLAAASWTGRVRIRPCVMVTAKLLSLQQ